MSNSENKIELFRLVAETLQTNVNIPEGKQLFCTIDENVLACPSSLETSFISPCSHEEVDTRIVLHAKDAVMHGLTKIILKATDTDIFVICLFLFTDIGAEELWIELGTAEKLRLFPIHDIHSSSGVSRSKGLLFFHSFTGCDSTTAFVGFGKVSCWKMWDHFTAQFTEVFIKLSLCDSIDDVTNDDIDQLEYFVSTLFMRTLTFSPLKINCTRKKLFLSKGVSLDKLPPSKDVLFYKMLRSIFQCIIWRNSLSKQSISPSVQNWGWTFNDGKISFLWSELPDVVKGWWDTFVKCNCKVSNCTRNCSCKKMNEPCTSLCGCNCYN